VSARPERPETGSCPSSVVAACGRWLVLLLMVGAPAWTGIPNAQGAEPSEAAAQALPLATALQQVHRLNRLQILTAELAMTRTGDTRVFRYAERLWRDHQEGRHVVHDLAQRFRIVLERDQLAPEGALHPDQSLQDLERLLRDLRSAPDAAFDHRYLVASAHAHRALIALMNRTLARRNPPPGMRVVIVDLLPIVHQHLQLGLALAAVPVR
jgi:predicted outer membrane protein